MLTNIKTLRRGNFEKIDIIHGGSGKALLLEDATGHKLLRFENFEVTNGPDLYVYLSRNLKPTGDTESLGDFINLGPLKGSKGNQNYEINQNIDGYNTAVIWCKQFGVLFSFAVLQ
ncbi:MAG: DM13 domain-containing protein [Candidatus Yanofskybacteria bacterium]|nr:DM13 domain-containing protein [Candidatus Yanofskybacteria bacterium]